jgi:hypothetical protein
MKKKIAKKWIKALRSGKYKQGKGYLKQINNKENYTHCCLGVLCELYNEDMKKKHKKLLKITRDHFSNFYCFNGNRVDLPIQVQQWANLSTSDGYFTDHRYVSDSLASLNDREKTFKDIATAIENNIENL